MGAHNRTTHLRPIHTNAGKVTAGHRQPLLERMLSPAPVLLAASKRWSRAGLKGSSQSSNPNQSNQQIVKSKSIESTNQSNPQSRSRPPVALIWMAPNSHTVLAASSYSYSQVAISTLQSPFGIILVRCIRSIVFPAIQAVRRLRQPVTAEFLSLTRPSLRCMHPS